MLRPIFISMATDKVEQVQVENTVHVLSFWLTQHLAPAWDQSPTTVTFTSNPDSASQFAENSTLIEVTDDMVDELGINLSQAIAKAFLNPAGNRLFQDAKGAAWELDPCSPVRGDFYPISDGSKTCNVSDFVMPAFYELDTSSELFDYCGVLTKPFTIAKGGKKSIKK